MYTSLGDVCLASYMGTGIAVKMKAEKLVVLLTIFYPGNNSCILYSFVIYQLKKKISLTFTASSELLKTKA